jgi:hypothetical protein
VRVLVGLIIAVLLVSFGASAQELRLYSVEEVSRALCRGEDFSTLKRVAEEIPEWKKFQNLSGPSLGIRMSTVSMVGELPSISRLEFSDEIVKDAREIVQEAFSGFKFDPNGETLVIDKACGLLTPTHLRTPLIAAQRALGWNDPTDSPAPLVRVKTKGFTMISRGDVPLTPSNMGHIIMVSSSSIRTAALDIRTVIVSRKKERLCYQVNLNQLEAARYIWQQVVYDRGSWRVVDCTIARQTPSSSQPSQPSTPDR